MADYRTRRIDLAIEPLVSLAAAAEHEGHRFIERLLAEWRDGSNCFALPGELFLGAFGGDRLIGVGGLNRDPYGSDAGVGRLRHLYVLRAHRRHGVGRLLIARLLGETTGRFHTIRLRTEAAAAARFYLACGFRLSRAAHATHELALDDV